MKGINLKSFVMLPIVVGLIFSFGYNGFSILTGGEDVMGKFLNFLAREEKDVSALGATMMTASGIAGILSALLMLGSIVKREFMREGNWLLMKWGLWFAMASVVLYGLPVRFMSNHSLAATLFFYTSLLFLLLWLVESRSSGKDSLFDKVKLLPLYLLLLYTMGQPGYNKIFDAASVMGGYERMFEGSILSQMPGGIPPFIYFLGLIELLAFALLAVSLVRGEFLSDRSKSFYKYGLLVMTATFTMLSFGLGLLLVFPGAVQLLMYGSFTTLMYVYAERREEQAMLVAKDNK